MLSPHQAEVASEAILEPKRQQLARNREKRRRWRAGRNNVLAGIIGLVFGAVFGDYFFGDQYPWILIGFGVGLLLAHLARRFPARINR